MADSLLNVKTSRSSKPEVFFGITSAVGTPLELVQSELVDGLGKRDYDLHTIKFSDLPTKLHVNPPPPVSSAGEYERVRALMDRGNNARQISGQNAILAALAVPEVIRLRKQLPRDGTRGHAYLFRQLKHPHEAYLLRKVYDEGLHLIGVHSPPAARLRQLKTQRGMAQKDAQALIQADEFEQEDFGQRVRDTFHLSDVFVRATGDEWDETGVKSQLTRFLALLFGDTAIHTPTIDEYGMFLAATAALRSSQLSRQVGAAILSDGGEVLSVGANEVPKAFGGQYWEGDSPDGRDHRQKRGDSTDYMRRDLLAEVLEETDPRWEQKSSSDQQAAITKMMARLKNTRVMNLTEFTRAAHAEMEALLAAARIGISVRGATLYTTTFPCHNCTKHIVAAGIKRVVYIEPYPKSLARDLHSDAIAIDEGTGRAPTKRRAANQKKVNFEAFVGIAPRRYGELFAMVTPEGKTIRRKDELGLPKPSTPGLRIKVRDYSYEEVESNVVKFIADITPKAE